MDTQGSEPPPTPASSSPSLPPSSSPPPTGEHAAPIPLARRIRATETPVPGLPFLSPPHLPPPPLSPSPLLMLELTPRQAGFDVLLTLLPIALLYLPSLIAYFSSTLDSERAVDVGTATLNFKWVEALFAVLIALYLIVRGGVRPASIGLGAPRPVRAVGWGLCGLVGAYVVVVVSVMVALPFVAGGPDVDIREEFRDKIQFAEAFGRIGYLQFATVLIAVVIHEELLFRGLLLPQLRRATGSWPWAVVLSSLVFALLHFLQGPIAMLQISGVAVVLALVFIVSRSLYAVMIAHYLFNFAQFGVMHWMSEHSDDLLKHVATIAAQTISIASP